MTQDPQLGGPARGTPRAMQAGPNNFDGLRLLGALMVLLSHQLALSAHIEPRIGGVKLGTLGVMLFFTISGFLVCSSWERDPHWWRYLCRRMLRIWPALAFSLTLCITYVCSVMIAPVNRAVIPSLLLDYAPNYIFVWRDGVFFPNNPYKYLNAVLWTIPLEVQCYAALAALGLLWRGHLRAAMLGLAATVVLLLLCTDWASVSASWPAFFQIVDEFNLPTFFLAGAIAYMAPIVQTTRAACWLTLLGGVAAWSGQTGMACVLLTAVLVLQVGPRSWPGLRSATVAGDLSYGIYLWAWPLQQLGISIFGTQTDWLFLLIVTLATTLFMAFLSWHLVEKHCLQLKPGVPLPTGGA